MNRNDESREIDLLSLVKTLWHRAWAIVLAMVIFGTAAWGVTSFLITPKYKASVLMYVNSTDISLGGTKVSISQGDLAVAQSLIDTYAVILNTRVTLNDVIEEAELPYTYEELVRKISASSVNSTEVFQIDVLDPSPEMAAKIANTIALVLPEKIASIVEGSSTRIVDLAVIPVEPDSPNMIISIAIGVMLGAIFASVIVVARAMMDDKIRDSDYLIQTYDIPVLAVIPDLLMTPKNTYSYYKSSDKEQ